MFMAEVEKQLHSSPAVGSLAPLVFFLPPADGDTPVQARFRAAFHNQVRFEVVQYPPWHDMIDRGADPVVQDATGKLALDYARHPSPPGPGAPAPTALAKAGRDATVAILEPLSPKSGVTADTTAAK